MAEPAGDEQERLFGQLNALAVDYRNAYGADRGLEKMAEQLCRLADDDALYGKGWTGLVRFLVRASG